MRFPDDPSYPTLAFSRALWHRTVMSRYTAAIAAARAEQQTLAARIVTTDDFAPLRTIAGLDMAIDRARNLGIAGVIVYQYPALTEITRVHAAIPLTFPYVPGLLSYRELPALLAALAQLPTLPDLLICDGQGIAHPRGIGLASHLGLRLDRPTIGCAKSLLVGTHAPLTGAAGATAPLHYRDRAVGVAVRTKPNTRPIYISPGHRISITTALAIIQHCCNGYRIPRPTREADRYVATCKQPSEAEY